MKRRRKTRLPEIGKEKLKRISSGILTSAIEQKGEAEMKGKKFERT